MTHYHTFYRSLFAAATLFIATSTWAATHSVTTLADSGPGSLRQTIIGSANGDIIEFSTNGTIILTSGELTITNNLRITGPSTTNLIISGNHSNRVFNISSNATVSLAHLTIQDGSSADNERKDANGYLHGGDGGGIYNDGILTLSHCILTKNSTGDGDLGGSGGGIYNKNILSAKNCTLELNTAGSGDEVGGYGGGIYNIGQLLLEDCLVQTNYAGSGEQTASGSGGGVCNRGTLQATNSIFRANSSGVSDSNSGAGGGIYNVGTLDLYDCTIHKNKTRTPNNQGSGNHGGGIYNAGELTATLSTFSDNKTADGADGITQYDTAEDGGHGGAIYNEGQLAITSCTFSNNIAGHGGGSYGDGGKAGHGGGIYTTTNSQVVALNNTLFIDNSAGNGGGSSGSGHPGGGGGAIYTQSPIVLDSCRFLSNRSGTGGNGYYGGNGFSGNGGGICNLSTAVLTNCSFFGNGVGQNTSVHAGGSGGAIYNDSTLSLVSCTLSQNDAPDGGGICNTTNGTPILLHNSLIAGNTATLRGVDLIGTYSSLGHNLIGVGNESTGLTNGVHNDLVGGFNAPPLDPRLVASGSNGAMTLAQGSPAIDQGDDALTGGVDQQGNARKQGHQVDIGAIETAFWGIQIKTSNGPVDQLVSVHYPNGSNTILSAVTAQSHWTFTGWSDGDTNLTRTITSPAASDTYTALYTEQPGPLTLYVATNGNNSADGLSWNSPLQTLQKAVEFAIDGDTVLVSNGVYNTELTMVNGGNTGNRVVITKAITVQSLNGPNSTIIAGNQDPDHPVRCAYLTDGILSGFSLTNGFSRGGIDSPSNFGPEEFDGTGGGACMSGGVLSHCVVSGNVAEHGGGVYGGILQHCIIQENSARNGGGTYNSALNHCILINNSVEPEQYYSDFLHGRGGGAHGGTLNNCMLTANTAWKGGGAYGSTLTQCTIVSNIADSNGSGVDESTLDNCIAWDNYRYNTRDNYSASILNHSCTTPMPSSGMGNIELDPKFADATNGNFRLTLSSPCINAGSNSSVTNATDLDGNPRTVGAAVDMGAYEFQPAPGYQTWAIQQAGNQLVPDQIDTNGIPNLLKYATGQTDQRAKSRATVQGGQFSMQFHRNVNATDVMMIVESKNALTDTTWSGIATNTYGMGWNAPFITESGNGSPVSVEIQNPVPSAANHYLRLRVVKP